MKNAVYVQQKLQNLQLLKGLIIYIGKSCLSCYCVLSSQTPWKLIFFHLFLPFGIHHIYITDTMHLCN